MSQGLIGGALWGVLAAGFGLVVVSQVAPPPDATTGASVAAPAPAAPPDVAVAPTPPLEPGKVAAADLPVPQPPVTPQVSAAEKAPLPPTPLPAAAPRKEVAEAVVVPAAPSVAPPEPEEPRKVAEAIPEVAEPAKPSILKKPDPLPATPPLAAKAPVPTADPLPGLAAATPAAPEVASAADAPAAPAAATAEKEAPPAAPPDVVTIAPEAVAALPQPSRAPILPAPAASPAAAPRLAAVMAAGPPPLGPSAPLQPKTPTVVVTEAPRPLAPAVAVAGQGDVSVPVATGRSGFQPGLVSPVPALSAADVPPVVGALPPPPPLTPEELAILAEEGAATADPALPEVIVLTEAVDPAAPSILKKPAPLVPVPSLAAKGQVPATDRLPTVTPDRAPDATEAPQEAAVLSEDARPIDRFARPFDNAAGKPVFAVVLIDTGDPQIDRAALAALPFPVTFALDPSAPESALAASIYRGAGQEVVMLATGLPEGATAADVEVSFGAHEAALPEAVAVLDMEVGGFQADRPLSSLVVPVLAGQGRGLLSWDRGLNAASQVARREGLRSGVIFRRLDGEGEPTAQIRRYLDRAAFKAAQDGRVIVAGETKADTVAALLEWAVEGRASTVALAPLTAALRVE